MVTCCENTLFNNNENLQKPHKLKVKMLKLNSFLNLKSSVVMKGLKFSLTYIMMIDFVISSETKIM